MKAVIQRVKGASLFVDGVLVSRIAKGLVVFFGVKRGDSAAQAEKLAKKVVSLRIFEDEQGKMNRSVQDIGGEILLVSQFTLYGDCTRGNRPSFSEAARPEEAISLYEREIQLLSSYGVPVCTGIFGADMQIEQQNDGPVTILCEI